MLIFVFTFVHNVDLREEVVLLVGTKNNLAAVAAVLRKT